MWLSWGDVGVLEEEFSTLVVFSLGLLLPCVTVGGSGVRDSLYVGVKPEFRCRIMTRLGVGSTRNGNWGQGGRRVRVVKERYCDRTNVALLPRSGVMRARICHWIVFSWGWESIQPLIRVDLSQGSLAFSGRPCLTGHVQGSDGKRTPSRMDWGLEGLAMLGEGKMWGSFADGLLNENQPNL